MGKTIDTDTGSCSQNLANAVIINAATEWRKAVKTLAQSDDPAKRAKAQDQKETCERFFLSEDFEILAPGELEGSVLLGMLQNEAEGRDPYDR